MRYNQFKILEQEVAPNGDVSLLTPAQQLNFIKNNRKNIYRSLSKVDDV